MCFYYHSKRIHLLYSYNSLWKIMILHMKTKVKRFWKVIQFSVFPLSIYLMLGIYMPKQVVTKKLKNSANCFFLFGLYNAKYLGIIINYNAVDYHLILFIRQFCENELICSLSYMYMNRMFSLIFLEVSKHSFTGCQN